MKNKEVEYVARFKKEGYEMSINHVPVHWKILERCNRKVFESVKQFDLLTMVASKGTWAMEHGLSCPRDVRKALEDIDNLESF